MAFPPVMRPSTWLIRFVRWIGCDRSPLRRTSDRMQAWVMLLTLVGYVPLAILTAGAAGHWLYEAGVRAQHADQPRPAAAVVLAAAEATKPVAVVWVPVRWTIDRRAHFGTAPVSYGTLAGTMVRLWIDRDGHVTKPPLTTEQLKVQVLTTKVITPVLLAELLALSLFALRWYLNRRRLAQWDSEWWSLDPLRARRGD